MAWPGKQPKKEIIDGSSLSIGLPESQVELQKEIIHPESDFSDMNMDLVVSNLGPNELYLVRENLELAGHLDLLDLKKASAFFGRNATIMVVTARAKAGFERRMLATQILQQTKETGQKKDKKGEF